MRTMLIGLSLAAATALLYCQSAAAFPIDAGALQRSAAAVYGLHQAQYSERRGRRTITKCYRDFVISRYVCHTYPRGW